MDQRRAATDVGGMRKTPNMRSSDYLAQDMRAKADAIRADATDLEQDWLDVADSLVDAANRLDAVSEALSRHPKCDKYDEDDVVSCGWKSAVRDITWAFTREAEAL